MPSVLWFAPNFVGYIRIVLCALACYTMPRDPWITTILYSISCLLDALDGYLARSKFGAVLDMVIDRSTTTCLLLYLASRYPQYLWAVQFLVSLDFSSHYMQMYSSLASGAVSHKESGAKHNWLLRLYYQNRIVLFSLCAMNELFFLLVYLHGFGPDTVGSVWLHKWLARLAHAVGPFCAIKHFMNFVQLCSASMVLVRLDDEGDDGEGKHISSRRRCSNSSPRKLNNYDTDGDEDIWYYHRAMMRFMLSKPATTELVLELCNGTSALTLIGTNIPGPFRGGPFGIRVVPEISFRYQPNPEMPGRKRRPVELSDQETDQDYDDDDFVSPARVNSSNSGRGRSSKVSARAAAENEDEQLKLVLELSKKETHSSQLNSVSHTATAVLQQSGEKENLVVNIDPNADETVAVNSGPEADNDAGGDSDENDELFDDDNNNNNNNGDDGDDDDADEDSASDFDPDTETAEDDDDDEEADEDFDSDDSFDEKPKGKRGKKAASTKSATKQPAKPAVVKPSTMGKTAAPKRGGGGGKRKAAAPSVVISVNNVPTKKRTNSIKLGETKKSLSTTTGKPLSAMMINRPAAAVSSLAQRPSLAAKPIGGVSSLSSLQQQPRRRVVGLSKSARIDKPLHPHLRPC